MTDSTPNEVELEFRGPVAHVRLNRPDALNAFSHSLVAALADALDRIDAHEDCRVIVLSGNGRAFSAGGDLKEFRQRLQSGRGDLVAFVQFVADTLTRIEHNPRPVIAAVSGIAVAGGLEMILCCDLVVASTEARIGDGHARYAVMPGGGGVARLIRHVSRNVANRLLLTGESVPARYLYEQGLITELVEPDRLHARVDEIADHVAGLSPATVRRMKRTIREAADLPLTEGLRLELSQFAQHIETPDFREGTTAFAEHRAPVFLATTGA